MCCIFSKRNPCKHVKYLAAGMQTNSASLCQKIEAHMQKKCGLMIKPVHRSPLCPVEMEMQHAQRLIVPLYSPSHSNISSTGLIIPAAGRGVNNNKKQVLKLLKDGLAFYFQRCVIFSRRAASFGWGRRRRSSHLIWTGFPRRYLICIIFFVYGDALVRGSSLVSAWYWWRIT